MLGQLLPQVVFGYALILTRIGAMLMVVPVLGETAISPRIRLALAFMIALVVYPAIAAGLPVLPANAFGLLYDLAVEATVGVMIGGAARLITSALNVAGTIIAFQSSLSVAQGFDPTQGEQGALIGTFLTLLATVLIFVTNLHHLLIIAIVHSFRQFPAGQFPSVADFAALSSEFMARSFVLAVQISAPFLAYGLIFYIGLGLVARLMPQLQVFFIAMPLNIYLAFVIFLMVIGASMSWFLDSFRDMMSVFTG